MQSKRATIDPLTIIVRHTSYRHVFHVLFIKLGETLAAHYIIIQIKDFVRDFGNKVGIKSQHTAGCEPGSHVSLGQVVTKHLRTVKQPYPAVWVFLFQVRLQAVDGGLPNRMDVVALLMIIQSENEHIQGLCHLPSDGQEAQCQAVFNVSVATVEQIDRVV